MLSRIFVLSFFGICVFYPPIHCLGADGASDQVYANINRLFQGQRPGPGRWSKVVLPDPNRFENIAWKDSWSFVWENSISIEPRGHELELHFDASRFDAKTGNGRVRLITIDYPKLHNGQIMLGDRGKIFQKVQVNLTFKDGKPLRLGVAGTSLETIGSRLVVKQQLGIGKKFVDYTLALKQSGGAFNFSSHLTRASERTAVFFASDTSQRALGPFSTTRELAGRAEMASMIGRVLVVNLEERLGGSMGGIIRATLLRAVK